MNSMMEYKGYHATIMYDAEDHLLVGEVFGITDSLNFHGTTIDEVENMFHQSIDNYLEMCAAIGKEPNKEFKGSFNIRISPELHRKAALEAAKRGITLNQYVAESIERSFEPHAGEKETTTVLFYVPYNTQEMCGFKSNNFINAYQTEGSPIEKEAIYSYV